MRLPAVVGVRLLAALYLIGGCTPAHLPGNGNGDGGVAGVCGDLRVGSGEECDDGNRVAGDGCDASCKLEIPPGCGNDVVAGAEECDDGNNLPGDGCGKSCKIERCGNGVLDPGEACEDNNTVAGDGCSANCKSDESCGNGILDPGETCDDGNHIDTDGCPASCQPARCGDGFVHAGLESCDDKNDVAGDGCTGCILDSCGNGTPDPGEECDLGAGNGMPGTSCFKSCIGTNVAMAAPIAAPIDPSANFVLAPTSVEAADLDGDGRLDLGISDPSASALVLAYGLGDGRVWPPRLQFTNGTGAAVALADLDKDGRLDAVVSQSGDTIDVLLGTADGFATGTSFSTVIDIGGRGPHGLAIADLTGDGKLDVVTANTDTNDVTVMVGDGTGGFVATTRLVTASGTTGDGPIDVAVGDVTGDGKVDIITANSLTDDVSVLPGLGGGKFGPPVVHTTRVGAGGAHPIAIALADVSNDGLKDVITANSSSDDVTVLAGLAGGDLAAPLRFVTLAGNRGKGPHALAVGDVTGDGRRDIVTCNGSDDVAVLVALGAGVAFAPAVQLPLNPDGAAVESKNPSGIAIVDLDRDGRADLVTANRTSSDLTVLRGTGSGEFAAPASYEVGLDFGGQAPVALAIGDLNDDGNRDAAVLGSDAILQVAGQGDGRFAPAQAISTQVSGPIAFGDLDGDGDLDWAAPRTQFLQVGLRTPSGAFASVFSPSDSARLVAAAVGNDDGDAALEMAAADESDLRLVEYDNLNGTPIGPSFPSLSNTPSHLVMADVTGDGALDLIATVPATNQVFIAVGDGAGNFATPVGVTTAVSTSGQAPSFVAIADVDGDGKADVCTANAGSNDVTILRGQGAGAFADPVIASAVFGAGAAQVSAVRAGDVNGDGLVDLVTANAGRGTVSVLIGFGDGGFAAPQSFDVGPNPHSIAVGDFDGDGLADVAAVTEDDGKVVVLKSGGHP